MAKKRLGIIMNGVTGRMGTNQHLIRSIVAIRAQGGVRLANGDQVVPDPILLGRDAGKLEALAKAHGIERWSTDLDAALSNQGRRAVFRRRNHEPAGQAAQAGDRGRQAHLLREADRREPRRRARSRAHGTRGQGQERRGPGQALSARAAQAQDLDRFGVLRPHPLGARRVRLLGVRGRLAAGATGRPGITARRTAAASCSTCSVTGATCSTICSAT